MGRFTVTRTGRDGDPVSSSRFSVTRKSISKKEDDKEKEKKSSASFLSSLPAYQRAYSAYTAPKTSTQTFSLPSSSKTPTTTQNIGTGALKAELADRRASGNFTMPGSHEGRVKELEAHGDTVRNQLRAQFQPLDYKGEQIGKRYTTAADFLNSSLAALAQEAAQESFLADLDRLSTRTTGRPGNISVEDFLSKSRYVPTGSGEDAKFNAVTGMYSSTGFDDILYDYINRNPKAVEIQELQDVQLGHGALGLDQGYLSQMGDREVGIFNYLYATQGPNAAYSYINEIKNSLTSRNRAEEEEMWRSMARESPADTAGMSVFSVLASPAKGLSYIGQLADYAADGTIDQNAGTNRLSYINSAIRSEASDIVETNWGAPGSFLYNTGMSMADFLYSTALSGGFGAAPGTAAAKASSGLALSIMGTGAAADTVIASKDRGLSDDQSFALGTIAGLAEIATEKFSLDALLKDPKNAVLFVLQNAGVEASEETASSLINLFADIAISKNKSEWQMSINDYISQGYSENEAFGKAFADQAKSIGLDALGGALSGGVLSGARVGANAIYNRASGAQAVDAGSPIIQNQDATDTEAQQQTQMDPLQALAEEMAAKEAEEIFPTVEERPRPKPQKAAVVSEQQQQETVPEPSWKKYTGAPRADGTNPAAQARAAARQAAESADLASMDTAERESFLQAYDMGRSGEGTEVEVSGLPVQSDAVYGAFFQGQDDYFNGSADRYQAYRTRETSAEQATQVETSVQEAQQISQAEAEQAPSEPMPVETLVSEQTAPETTPKKEGIQIPIEERTWQDAGNRKVNAFQYDNPELRPYFAEAAKALQYDLASAVKGERMPVYDASSETGKDVIGVTGTKRSVTDPIAQALDNAGLSYAQIEKALDDLIADNGQENYAAAKKVELVLDDMLANGYTDSDGQDVPPNQEYISVRDAASRNLPQGSTEYRMSEAEWESLMAQEPESPVTMPDGKQVTAESSVGAAAYGFDPYTNLQGRYGTLPEGENPSRVVDVPAKTSDKSKVSLTARTVMEAAATPDSALPDIAQLVVDGRLSYMPISNKQRAVMAENKIKNVGYSDALANWRSDVRAGKSSADLVAMGAQLYNATVNAGDTKAAMDILYDYTRLIRSGAQATQAARILKTLTPSGTLYMIQKEVNNLNEAQSGKKKRKVTSADNVPVGLWMQRVGENLADELSRRVNAPKDQIQTVSQTILSDLRRFANETAPNQIKAGKKRTEMDRIMDLFQNKTAYQEAWDAAKATLSDTFENDPDALAAFDSWLDQSLDYAKALTKELTKQSEIVIPEELADAYLSAETEEARAKALDAIYQNVADQIPSTWVDKWNAWRYLSMLGNPRTHIRNIAGNIGFIPVRAAKDRIAAVIESGISAASKGKLKRTKSFTYTPKLYAAAWKDFDNVSDVLGGSKYDDVSSIISDKRTIFKLKPLEAARRGNSNLLSAEDMVFKRVTYAGALAGYLKSNGVTARQLSEGKVDSELLSSAREYAGQEALKATFNDRNRFSDAVASIGSYRGDNVFKKAGSEFVSAVLPFRRTPANILVRGFEYSPLGLAKGLTYDLIQVKKKNMTGAEAIDNIAAGLTGSVLMALGGLLAAAGIVTGGEGDDEKQAALNDLTGGQTYALNLPGGGSVTLDWLAPEALPFFMGVQAMESFGEQGLTGDTIAKAFSSISEPMLEMSMLQSLNDLIDSVTYSDMKVPGLVGSALISYLAQAIPTIGGQIERTSQDKRYSSYTNKDSALPTDVQYALGKVSARIPGWDFQQIPYIDAWGREEETGSLLNRAFNNFINPAYTSSINVTAVDEEIQRLYSQLGDGSVVPSRADKSFTVNKETVYLSGDQYVEYATKKGQTAYDLLDEFIRSSSYKSMSDSEKADAVKDVYKYADAVGKVAVSDYKPDGWVAKVMDGADTVGLEPWEYIIYNIAYDMAESELDEDGKTIPGSKQEKVIEAIDDMSWLSEEQKSWLFRSKYSSDKNNPWA